MKKKLSSFLYIFISIFCFFFINNVFAKTFCENLTEEIRFNHIEKRLDFLPDTHYWGIRTGVNLKYDDEEKIFRDKDNNIVVISTLQYAENGDIKKDNKIFPAYGVIETGDIIIEINNKSVSSLEDYEIDQYIWQNPLDENQPYTVSESQTIKFGYKDKSNNFKKEKLTIKPLYHEHRYVYPQLYLDNITKVDGKDGKFESVGTFMYYWEVGGLPEVFKTVFDKLGISENKASIGRCDFTPEDFNQLGLFNPALGFNNQIELNREKIVETINISFYEDTLELVDGTTKDQVFAYYQVEGNVTLKSDFNFRAFPFDSQDLKFELWAMAGDELEIDYTDLDQSFVYQDYSNLKIPEWKVNSTDISSKSFYSKYHDENRLMYELTINIERQYGYYFYKVLVPIFIILVVAWTALWIPSREIESRLTITIVCLLSLIAYNFIVDKDIPKLDYLTLLDYIILLSYLFAAIPTVFTVIAYNVYEKNTKSSYKFDQSIKFYGPLAFVFLGFVLFLFQSINNPNTAIFLRFLN